MDERAGLRPLVVGILVAVLFALGAARAQAVVIYPQATSFGTDGTSGTSFSGIRQVAFDQASDRLYVLSAFPPRLHAFDASTPGTYTPLGAPFPLTVESTGSERLSDVSVDHSGLGSTGNIAFTTTENNNAIYVFDSAGVLQPGFPVNLNAGSNFMTGAGIDPSGNIWAGNYYPQRFEKFSSAGAPAGTVSTAGTGNGYPGHVAFDSAANAYVTHYYSGNTWKYAAAGGYATRTQLDSQEAVEVDVDRSTGKIYVVRSSSVAVYTSAGTLERTIATGISSNFYGVAVDGATGGAHVSDGNANKVRVFLPVNAPVATTGDTEDLVRNSVTVKGHVEPDGGGDVTDCKFEYVTDAAFKATGYTNLSSGGTKPCSETLPMTSGQDVSAELTGLTTDTNFHYRLVSSNATPLSTNPGGDKTFTTPTAVPGLSTDGVSDVTQTSATLNASFMGDGLATTYKIEWGPTTAYGKVIEGNTGSPTGLTEIEAPITGLSVYLPETLPYHYRVVATNSTGTTISADKAFFAAPPHLPVITDTSVDQVTSTTATLSSSINPGNGPTIYLVEYGVTTNHGSASAFGEPLAGDDEDHPVSVQLLGLSPGTTYHFRVLAINFTGTSHSADQTFTTPNVPTIVSSASSSVGQTTAHLTASVIANASPTTTHFEYGTTSAYAQSTTPAFIGQELLVQAVDADLAGLAPGTTYHYRAVAGNGVGTSTGPDRTFTTQAATAENPPAAKPRKCRKGFVKRKGRCVKKKKRTSRRGSHRNG